MTDIDPNTGLPIDPLPGGDTPEPPEGEPTLADLEARVKVLEDLHAADLDKLQAQTAAEAAEAENQDSEPGQPEA